MRSISYVHNILVNTINILGNVIVRMWCWYVDWINLTQNRN
jgi:hypothetical protein